MDLPELKIAATENRVIILQDPKAENKGKILLPEDAKKKPNFGVVVAVGPGKKREDGTRTPMTIERGMHVVYSSFATTPVEVDGKEYLIIDEPGIIAYFTA